MRTKAQPEHSTVVAETVEFWAYQYISKNPHNTVWWPADGVGEYPTREAAEQAALEHDYNKIRAMRIRTSVEYAKPIVKEPEQ